MDIDTYVTIVLVCVRVLCATGVVYGAWATVAWIRRDWRATKAAAARKGK